MSILQLGLTASQKQFRSRVLGGSDANIIMGGDHDRIIRLWREKRGEIEGEDLSDILPVQMGSFTEPFNIYWFEKQTGRKVTHRGDERLSIDHPWMASTLDGLTDGGLTVLDAKHVNAFAREDETQDKYYPQLVHNALVCGVNHAVLSVFYGTLKYQYYDVVIDPIYAMQLIEIERGFWDCVQSGEPPVAIAPPAPPREAIRKADMTGSNTWASAAASWLEHKDAAKKFAAAEKDIKGAVEADVIEARGHGILAARNKAGSLSIKPIKD